LSMHFVQYFVLFLQSQTVYRSYIVYTKISNIPSNIFVKEE
jgi:hypothetical protein